MNTGIYRAYFDGSASPNPGEINIGGCIKNGDKNIFKFSKNMGRGTNSEAEYLALIEVLGKIVSLKIRKITVFGDSQLIIHQMNGVYKIKQDNMKYLSRQAKALLTHIPECTLSWIKRSKNKEADALSKG